MTVTRIQLSQTYVQDEHQRVLQDIAENVRQLEQQIAAMQTTLTAIKNQLGIK